MYSSCILYNYVITQFVTIMLTLCRHIATILNTVSLHTAFADYCSVRYGRVGRYGYLYAYPNSGDLQLSEHAATPVPACRQCVPGGR